LFFNVLNRPPQAGRQNTPGIRKVLKGTHLLFFVPLRLRSGFTFVLQPFPSQTSFVKVNRVGENFPAKSSATIALPCPDVLHLYSSLTISNPPQRSNQQLSIRHSGAIAERDV
jgi:hypothetical protein